MHSLPAPPTEWAVETHGLTKRFSTGVAVDPREPVVTTGKRVRLPRAERGRQDHADPYPARADPGRRGRAALLGIPVPDRRRRALARVGAIVDEPRFHRHLSGRENLRGLAAARGGRAPERIDPSLARVGLAARADDQVSAYSMGMRQRLGLAACLLGDPELLILDEPMNGLDPAGMLEMRGFIRDLVGEGRTVMLSSHLLDEVERTCDAVAIVDHGRVVRQGSIAELVRGATRSDRPDQMLQCGRSRGCPATGRHHQPGRPGGGRVEPVTLPAGATKELSGGAQPAPRRCRDRGLPPRGDPGDAGRLVPRRDQSARRFVMTAWLPTPALIGAKILELRKRRALMILTLLFTLGVPALVLGVRLVFHLVDPGRFGPASSPSIFGALSATLAEFSFIIAATVGATVGTTDLADGVFRHLVITGRSRLALYLARVPAGLAILLPLVGVAFALMCLVNTYQGTPQPTALLEGDVAVPVHLDEAQLASWLHEHPQQAEQAYGRASDISFIYRAYTRDEANSLNPSATDLTHIGLWLELDVTIAFMVGLGLGQPVGPAHHCHHHHDRPGPAHHARVHQRATAVCPQWTEVAGRRGHGATAADRDGGHRRTARSRRRRRARPAAHAHLGDDRGHRRVDRRLDRAGRLAHGQPRRLSRLPIGQAVCHLVLCAAW